MKGSGVRVRASASVRQGDLGAVRSRPRAGLRQRLDSAKPRPFGGRHRCAGRGVGQAGLETQEDNRDDRSPRPNRHLRQGEWRDGPQRRRCVSRIATPVRTFMTAVSVRIALMGDTMLGRGVGREIEPPRAGEGAVRPGGRRGRAGRRPVGAQPRVLRVGPRRAAGRIPASPSSSGRRRPPSSAGRARRRLRHAGEQPRPRLRPRRPPRHAGTPRRGRHRLRGGGRETRRRGAPVVSSRAASGSAWSASPITPPTSRPARPAGRRVREPAGRAPDWLVDEVARRDADVVVVTPHWGPNMVDLPGAARPCRRSGLWRPGRRSSPVTPRTSSTASRGRVLFDLGDFIDDYAVDPALRNDLGLLWTVTVGSRGPPASSAFPSPWEAGAPMRPRDGTARGSSTACDRPAPRSGPRSAERAAAWSSSDGASDFVDAGFCGGRIVALPDARANRRYGGWGFGESPAKGGREEGECDEGP